MTLDFVRFVFTVRPQVKAEPQEDLPAGPDTGTLPSVKMGVRGASKSSLRRASDSYSTGSAARDRVLSNVGRCVAAWRPTCIECSPNSRHEVCIFSFLQSLSTILSWKLKDFI
jgi:hypothetical protein